MLLRLELGPSREAGRIGAPMGTRGRKRPYEWLRLTQHESFVRQKQTGTRVAPRDLLHPLPLNTPTELDYLPGHRIRLTLLDANHMPGAVMFLVEGQRGAVLHTGDCRAEKWWLEALIRNPVMQRYVSWEEAKVIATREEIDNDPMLRSQAEELEQTQSMPMSESLPSAASQISQSTTTSPGPTSRLTLNRDLRLKNIYIDDEAIASAEWPMTKKDAVLDLISLMESYPADTNFFFDMWTWGYEEIYFAVGKSFQRKGKGHRVHVDKYKREMYRNANDAVSPFLTTNTHTRFHACERKGTCEFLSAEERLAGEREAFESLSQQWSGPMVIPPSSSESMATEQGAMHPGPMMVYVKPIDSSKRNWKDLSTKLRQEINEASEGRRSYPRWLACPINRHSALPELQRLVRAFRPAVVTPTTCKPHNYFLASKYLGPALGPGGLQRMEEEAKATIGLKHWNWYERALSGDPKASNTDTVADEVRRFREALRQTLDLSQSLKAQDPEYEYDADCSGAPSGFPRQSTTCPPSPVHAPPALPENKAPRPPSPDLPSRSSEPPRPTQDPDATFLACAPLEAAQSSTVLDDDLARRYFIVLRMFVEPGLRLKNLPGGTEGPQAWRAVRKLRPLLARRTEETMMKEVGVIPPPWTAPAPISAAPSPMLTQQGMAVPKASVGGDLLPHELLRREVKRAVELELARRDQRTEQDGKGRADAQPTEGDIEHGREAAVQSNGESTMEAAKADTRPVSLDVIPSTTAVDWLAVLLNRLQFSGLGEDLDDDAPQRIFSDAKVYSQMLAGFLHFSNTPALLVTHAGTLITRMKKCMGAWSIALQQCPRHISYDVLLALAYQMEAVTRLAALLLTREMQSSIDNFERSSLTTTVSHSHEYCMGVGKSPATWRSETKCSSNSSRSTSQRDGKQPPALVLLAGLSMDQKNAVRLRVRRVIQLLAFAMQEGKRTLGVLPSSPSSPSLKRSPRSALGKRGAVTSGRQGSAKRAAGTSKGSELAEDSILLEQSGDATRPRLLRGIAEQSRRFLKF